MLSSRIRASDISSADARDAVSAVSVVTFP
jgi:hypothetical protein